MRSSATISTGAFASRLLYGTDYKYTFSNGILSYQYTEHERLYGFDPVMYYLDFYFPNFFQGENLRVGRYISIPDIEAQLAPNNITYSHSLLYTYDPYTQNGIVSTTMLNRNWKVQLELSAGNDISPTDKHFRQPTPAACVIYTTDSGADALLPLHERPQQPEFRLEQRPARRHHLVPQVQRALAHGYRGLVHVAKPYAERLESAGRGHARGDVPRPRIQHRRTLRRSVQQHGAASIARRTSGRS